MRRKNGSSPCRVTRWHGPLRTVGCSGALATACPSEGRSPARFESVRQALTCAYSSSYLTPIISTNPQSLCITPLCLCLCRELWRMAAITIYWAIPYPRNVFALGTRMQKSQRMHNPVLTPGGA